MKVLYFTRDYTPHDVRFLNAIAALGHEGYFLRLCDEKRGLDGRPLPEGILAVDWRWGKGLVEPSSYPEVAEDLRRVAAEIHPDVIHSGPLPDVSYIVALADLHPHVAMSWGFDLNHDIYVDPAQKDRATVALAHADWFLGDCYTELDSAAALGYPRSRASIFPWGIDPRRFSPGESSVRSSLARDDDFLMLSLRSLEPNYSVETTIRAFIRAAGDEPSLKLMILADGSESERLKALATQSSPEIQSRIFWLGRKPYDELVDYYRAADLYLSSSVTDGSSVSLLEAMGCGLPVLVSDIPGNLEWVEEGVTGFTFPVGGTEALAAKMIALARDRERLKTVIGTAARERIVQDADWEKNTLRITKAYENARGRNILVIQARMGSSRLPGKVLKDFAGQPMLNWVVKRGAQAALIDDVVIATTTDKSDDPIADWAAENGVKVVRGSVFDVLSRYMQVVNEMGLKPQDRIIRVTGDCPLIDPGLIDDLIRFYDAEGADFAANRLPPPWKRTYPIGLDEEMVSVAWLARADAEAKELYEREHVMPWFYNTEGRCKVRILDHEPDYGAHRWTVDTPEDHAMMTALFAQLPDPMSARWTDVLAIVAAHPEIERLNESTQAKQVDAVDERSQAGQS